jgi:hypothetical protein
LADSLHSGHTFDPFVLVELTLVGLSLNHFGLVFGDCTIIAVSFRIFAFKHLIIHLLAMSTFFPLGFIIFIFRLVP